MILLTGASGYLGQKVLTRLQQRGVAHVPLTHVFDLTNLAAVEGILDGVEPTGIIHCAAVVPKSPQDYDHPEGATRSVQMVRHLLSAARCPIVFASSLTASEPTTAYASGKRLAEAMIGARQLDDDVVLRLPGLFGLPRRSGVIYESALKGEVKDSYGPYPAMHVEDAAEYLVRAATMPSDGDPEPFSVTYGNARVEAVYGSLGLTFQERVQELVEQLRAEVNA